jgi:hypothetical protein
MAEVLDIVLLAVAVVGSQAATVVAVVAAIAWWAR